LLSPGIDTLIIDYPDLAVTCAHTRFVTDQVIRNPVIGRQLALLAVETGFEFTNIIPITMTFTNAQDADKVLGIARVTSRAVAAHYLGEREGEQWLEHLATQPFFASTTLYVLTGRRPAAQR
jgi:hypothetical protein